MLFGEGEPSVASTILPAQDFSIMADLLRHELPRVWYEDAQKFLRPVIKNRHHEPAEGSLTAVRKEAKKKGWWQFWK